MKRIISLIIAVIFVMMLGSFAIFAEGSTAPVIEVQDTSRFDEMLEGLTNSTFWTTMGTVLLSVIGMLAMFKKHFGNISTLISGKAETSEINKALKGATEEMSAEFRKKISELEAKLAEADNDEKKLMAMFTIFVSNANINPNAKAEIMKYLTGIKDISGKIVDVVETANKMIEDANAVEEKIPTPALNSIVTEDEDGDTESKMVLG